MLENELQIDTSARLRIRTKTNFVAVGLMMLTSSISYTSKTEGEQRCCSHDYRTLYFFMGGGEVNCTIYLIMFIVANKLSGNALYAASSSKDLAVLGCNVLREGARKTIPLACV